MAIIRNGLGDYEQTNAKRPAATERHMDDFDLRWAPAEFTTFSVYVIDSHEYFTCGSLVFHGPSLIVAQERQDGYFVDEYYVNDPRRWAWIRRSIREGWLSVSTVPRDDVNEQVEVRRTARKAKR